jgi:hypothetical protein
MITPQIIRDVIEDELKALRPVILALKHNDYGKLEALKDIYLNDFKLDKFFNQALQAMAKRNLYDSKVNAVNGEKKEAIDLTYEATKWLMEAQVPANHADVIVKALIDKNKNILLPELKAMALQMYAKLKQQLEKKLRSGQKKTKEDKIELNIDLQGDVLPTGGI